MNAESGNGTLENHRQSRRVRGKVERGVVLAVDDDQESLGILKELLEMSGYPVVTATSGREGIEVFQQESPHLVITDIRMPNMDGLELLRRIGEIESSVPVILVTGFGDLDNALAALRRGAYDFLQKPINPDILLNTVRQGLEHYRLKSFEKDYTRILEEQVVERTRELAETNDFLKGILDSSEGVSIVLTDFDQNVLFWNKGAEKIFGYSAGEMIGSKITRIYPDDEPTRQAVALFREKIKQKTGTVRGKMWQFAKDGRKLTISLSLSPMVDSSGEVRGLLGLGQDVTEEVRLHEEVLHSYRRIQRIQVSSIFALAKLAESRDGEISNHLRRIQDYSRALCLQLRTWDKYRDIMTDRFIDDLVQSSILHDIGKVGIPDAVLFNTNKFQVEDYEIMKRHTIFGGRALEEAAVETGEESFLSLGKDIAYYHHERWDGKGYPFFLEGEEIPLAARIVAVADVYDALTTQRRYKRAYSHEEACSMMARESGKQFDPDMVAAFLQVEQEFKAIRERDAAENLQLHLPEKPLESEKAMDRPA